MPNIKRAMMGAAGSSETSYYLLGWGQNNIGQLSKNNTTNYSSPVQVGTSAVTIDLDNAFKHASASNNITFWITDGKLYATGNGDDGRLGTGNTTSISVAVQVGSLTSWTQVSAGSNNGLGLQADGSMWSWGRGFRGFTGLNNTTDYSSPVQIGALTTWVNISSGGGGSHAIKSDGTMWGWGQNAYNAFHVGDNSATNRSSPVQIKSSVTWAQGVGKISHGQHCQAAIDTSNKLWTWGSNRTGSLGHGDTTKRSSPTQVGTLTNWKQVSCNQSESTDMMAAVKTDGTLWTWGDAVDGGLGHGNTTDYSSPVQVGSLTDWDWVETNASPGFAARKTDGTVWTVGSGGSGELGNGASSNKSSPVQVGSDSDWGALIQSNYRNVLAIKAA